MSLNVRHLVFTALFAALFVAMSAIKIPLAFSPVPISLQNLALMLAGAFLGARLGFLSIAIVIVLTAVGLPMLQGQGGISYLMGGTGGFLIAFPFCALLVGYFTAKLFATNVRRENTVLFYMLLFLIFEIFGSLASYLIGIPWLAAVYDFSLAKSMAVGCYPFLPGDTAKAILATVIVGALHNYVPIIGSKNRLHSGLTIHTENKPL
jgi:biotin transport system substrate-specific component